jgi:chaperonin GroES
MMVEASKDITAVKDILTGDTNGQTQTATTTLAMIEQGLKVFTAIYKRIYRALKDEFKLLFKLNAQHIDEKTYYTFQDQEEAVEKSDYDLEIDGYLPGGRSRRWSRTCSGRLMLSS